MLINMPPKRQKALKGQHNINFFSTILDPNKGTGGEEGRETEVREEMNKWGCSVNCVISISRIISKGIIILILEFHLWIT